VPLDVAVEVAEVEGGVLCHPAMVPGPSESLIVAKPSPDGNPIRFVSGLRSSASPWGRRTGRRLGRFGRRSGREAPEPRYPTHRRRTGADLALVPPTCGQAGEQGMRGHAHPRGEPGSRRPSMRWSQETPSMPRAAMQRYAPTAGFIEAASKACAGGGSFRRKREPSLVQPRACPPRPAYGRPGKRRDRRARLGPAGHRSPGSAPPVQHLAGSREVATVD
jgi:hypothetical protein